MDMDQIANLLFQLKYALAAMLTDHKQGSFRISFLIAALVFFSLIISHHNVKMMQVINLHTALPSQSDFLITARSF